MVCELCGNPIPTDSLGREDSHALNTGQFHEQIPHKIVCWKCYVDYHVKLCEEKCVCPKCGSPVKWAGTYEDWANFKCSQGHIINVNFLKPKHEYKAGDLITFQGRVYKITQVFNDGTCHLTSLDKKEGVFYAPIDKIQPYKEGLPTKETDEDKYGDWTVYYNATEQYWFLRNEKTLQDHPKHFDHKPTIEEIKATVEEKPKYEMWANKPKYELDSTVITADGKKRQILQIRKLDPEGKFHEYLLTDEPEPKWFSEDSIITQTEMSSFPLTHKKQGKYSIHIEPPQWEGYKYALRYSKNYGNMSSGATEFKTKQELLEFVKTLFLEWESYDSIVGRHGDKVTPKNLDFKSFTTDITKQELFGNKRLDAFFGN